MVPESCFDFFNNVQILRADRHVTTNPPIISKPHEDHDAMDQGLLNFDVQEVFSFQLVITPPKELPPVLVVISFSGDAILYLPKIS